MNEIQIVTDLNLNQLLRALNGFFLNTSMLLNTDKHDEEEKLNNIFLSIKTFHEKKLNTHFKEFITDLAKKAKEEQGKNEIYTSNHNKIFQFLRNDNSRVSAWLGDKDKPQSFLHNKGLVIGLTFKHNKFIMQYRLDYDENKRLHFNLDFINEEDKKFNFAICEIKPPELYYGIESSKDYDEIVKFKFFIKMTCSYLESSIFSVPDNRFSNIAHQLGKIEFDDKGERDVFIGNIIKNYTKDRNEKSARIGHDIIPNETDSEKKHTEEAPQQEKKDKKTKLVSQQKAPVTTSPNSALYQKKPKGKTDKKAEIKNKNANIKKF